MSNFFHPSLVVISIVPDETSLTVLSTIVSNTVVPGLTSLTVLSTIVSNVGHLLFLITPFTDFSIFAVKNLLCICTAFVVLSAALAPPFSILNVPFAPCTSPAAIIPIPMSIPIPAANFPHPTNCCP